MQICRFNIVSIEQKYFQLGWHTQMLQAENSIIGQIQESQKLKSREILYTNKIIRSVQHY